MKNKTNEKTLNSKTLQLFLFIILNSNNHDNKCNYGNPAFPEELDTQAKNIFLALPGHNLSRISPGGAELRSDIYAN